MAPLDQGLVELMDTKFLFRIGQACFQMTVQRLKFLLSSLNTLYVYYLDYKLNLDHLFGRPVPYCTGSLTEFLWRSHTWS